MPVNGFPTMLEGIIDKIFEHSHLTSYKIAGLQERTTLVLRFDATIDSSESNNHRPFPVSYRRKSPSQLKRDSRRKQLHLASSKKIETAVTDTRDSYIQHQDTCSVTDVISTETTCNDGSVIKSPLVLKEAAQYENTLNQADIINECETSSSEEIDNEHITTITDTQQDTDHASNCSTAKSNDSSEDQQEDDTPCDREHTRSQECTHNSKEDDDITFEIYYRQLSNNDRLQLRKFKIEPDKKQVIIRPDRNNSFQKLLFDNYDTTYSILAETDDLIIEYDLASHKIINFVIKDSEEKTKYERMRLQHVETWTDNTHHIREEFCEDAEELVKILPYFKRWITSRNH